MSRLFESTGLKGITLNNRFVRSATWEGLATKDGSVTPQLADVSVRLARGGVGLIISGHAYVSPEGQATPGQLGAYSDKHITGLADMAQAVHNEGSKLILQVAHAGVLAPFSLSGLEAMGPSPAPGERGPMGRAMTLQEIETTAEAFGQAAGRARRAGFDGVQVHGAHGYLVSQFCSPFFNKRNDLYGGSIENRARMAVDILKAIRRVTGPDYPVLIKINAEDFLEGGLTVDDMLLIAVILERAGYDAVEMSGGTLLSGNRMPSRPGKRAPGAPEAYYEGAARLFKEKVGIPLILVGGIRTFETAERLITEGTADYPALSRPLIREPALIARWRSGDRRPALCISDNGCFRAGLSKKGLHCPLEARREKGSQEKG